MIREKLAKILDVYTETCRVTLSFVEECSERLEKIHKFLLGFKERPYPVVVQLKATTLGSQYSVGQFAWFKPGETKTIIFKPHVQIGKIMINCSGALITQVVVKNIVYDVKAVTSMQCADEECEVGNRIAVIVHLPDEVITEL